MRLTSFLLFINFFDQGHMSIHPLYNVYCHFRLLIRNWLTCSNSSQWFKLLHIYHIYYSNVSRSWVLDEAQIQVHIDQRKLVRWYRFGHFQIELCCQDMTSPSYFLKKENCVLFCMFFKQWNFLFCLQAQTPNPLNLSFPDFKNKTNYNVFWKKKSE